MRTHLVVTVSRVVETVESNLYLIYAAFVLNYNKTNECVRFVLKYNFFLFKLSTSIARKKQQHTVA